MSSFQRGKSSRVNREKSPRYKRQTLGFTAIVIGCGSLIVGFATDLQGVPLVNQQTRILLVIEGGLSFFFGMFHLLPDESDELERAVRFLQPLEGKPESLIRRYCGAPSERQDSPDGALLTWRTPDYAITLLFTDSVCQRVISECVVEH